MDFSDLSVQKNQIGFQWVSNMYEVWIFIHRKRIWTYAWLLICSVTCMETSVSAFPIWRCKMNLCQNVTIYWQQTIVIRWFDMVWILFHTLRSDSSYEIAPLAWFSVESTHQPAKSRFFDVEGCIAVFPEGVGFCLQVGGELSLWLSRRFGIPGFLFRIPSPGIHWTSRM